MKLILGDCLEAMKKMDENSIDAIVTDPPAGISFMGRDWDSDKGGRDNWIKWMENIAKECLRVIKPGGHALVWSLPRTSHWTATAWENSGFEPRDRIAHCFGSGFPKSRDISKALDSESGAERKIIKQVRVKSGGTENLNKHNANDHNYRPGEYQKGDNILDITEPATEEAKKWEGWGTALKPAIEDWWLFRKPLSEPTVAKNVLRWGTGAINIDGCRVSTIENLNGGGYTPRANGNSWSETKGMNAKGRCAKTPFTQPSGRWPANLIHDGSQMVLELFPKTGSGNGGEPYSYAGREYNNKDTSMFNGDKPQSPSNFNDSGSASRFFYCAKSSRNEKELGLFDKKPNERFRTRFCTSCGKNVPERGACGCDADIEWREAKPSANIHPTVKPLSLMTYLCRLITPPGGMLLDPFMGSGTTGIAAVMNGYDFIGIELSEEYMKIAKARIKYAEEHKDENDI